MGKPECDHRAYSGRFFRGILCGYPRCCPQRQRGCDRTVRSYENGYYPYEQLADFLCVERAAMSVELSKPQKEGLLKTNHSHFELNAEAVNLEQGAEKRWKRNIIIDRKAGGKYNILIPL